MFGHHFAEDSILLRFCLWPQKGAGHQESRAGLCEVDSMGQHVDLFSSVSVDRLKLLGDEAVDQSLAKRCSMQSMLNSAMSLVNLSTCSMVKMLGS